MMPELELASLLQPISCWAYNTQFIRAYLFYLYRQRKKNPGIMLISDHLAMMQVFSGIQAGIIVVDCHVANAARAFGFVPMELVNSEEISVMLARWLPSTEYAHFNETIGGLNRLLGKGKTKEKKLALEVEKELNCRNIINRLMMKDKGNNSKLEL